MALIFRPDEKGILTDRQIGRLADAGAIICGRDFDPDQVQPASLDLRLGEVAYRVRASFLPGPTATVMERIDAFGMHRIDWPDGSTNFYLAHQDWIRLLRRCGFEIEDLVQLRPAADATTTHLTPQAASVRIGNSSSLTSNPS